MKQENSHIGIFGFLVFLVFLVKVAGIPDKNTKIPGGGLWFFGIFGYPTVLYIYIDRINPLMQSSIPATPMEHPYERILKIPKIPKIPSTTPRNLGIFVRNTDHHILQEEIEKHGTG